MKIYNSIAATIVVFSVLLISCNKEEVIEQVVVPGETLLVIDNRVGEEDFVLNKDYTLNGVSYQFEKLRYWVSNIVLLDQNDVAYEVPDSYFLMEEIGDLDLTGTISDHDMVYPAKKRDQISLIGVPEGEYRSIRFSIGVDARRNDNLSLQAGELSIANGMSNISWMWHTSYIFSSIGGKISDGSADPVAFLAETGLNENYKTVSISLESPLLVKAGSAHKLTLSLDLAEVLGGLNMMETPKIGARQPDQMRKIADNFSGQAFRFRSVE